MNIIVWLVIGSLVGGIASTIMGTNARQDLIVNVAVGTVGALTGGWLISGGSINGSLPLMTFVVSMIAAVMLLAILSLLRRSMTA